MAEVDVKNQPSETAKDQTSKIGGPQRQASGTGVSRSRGNDPYGFGLGLSPAELFSANPFSLMQRMSEAMDRGAFGSWHPALEVSESNGEFHVHADLPGLKPEDVKVEVTGDTLTIHGERKSEHEDRSGRTYRSERQYGEFYRSILLPEGANADQVKAQFNNGVLEISVPVPEAKSNRREIPISAGANAAQSTSAGSTEKASASQTATAGGSTTK